MPSLRKLILPLVAVAAFSLPGIAAAECTAGHGKTASLPSSQSIAEQPATMTGGKG